MIITSRKEKSVLVEMTHVELANILGKSNLFEFMETSKCGGMNVYSSSKPHIDFFIENKVELGISSAYNKSIAVNKVSLRNESYNSVRAGLEEMLKALTPAEDLIEKMNKVYKES